MVINIIFNVKLLKKPYALYNNFFVSVKMANRRPQNAGGRRMDFGRVDRNKNFNRPGVSPWQGGGPSTGIQSLLPLGGNSTEATLALANNLISNLLQNRQNAVPSLLDMPMRRDFGGDLGRFDRGFGPNRVRLIDTENIIHKFHSC